MANLPLATRLDHLALRASDPAAAARWYSELLGGEVFRPGDDRQHGARFASTALQWRHNPAPPPSEGSVLDHFGWSVPDLERTLAAMSQRGAQLVVPPRRVGDGGLLICFVVDPWGAKVELLEDRRLLGFHHLHLLLPDPEPHRAAMLRLLGGKAEQFNGMLPALRFDQHLLLYRADPAPRTGSRGRAIDHLVLRLEGAGAGALADAAEALALAGLELVDRYGEGDAPARGGYVEAPGGFWLELREVTAPAR